MSKYSIGLDLGINNVGWAIYDYDTKMIIDKGVVRFKASDTAKNRRNLRSSRRLNKRKHHRVERIANYLKEIKFHTARSYEPELLLKRIKGLNEQLTEQEITNIIYYFAIHRGRGYVPFDDEKSELEIKALKDDEYPCYYLKEFYDYYDKYRGEADLILMKDNIRELKAILLKQSEFNDKLNIDTINAIIEILSSKRQFWEGPGAPQKNQLSPYGRYRNKEDLEKYEKDNNYHKYLYEMLIGKCDLSIDKFGNKENVVPKCNYYAEEFNFYNDFINMTIISPSMLADLTEEYRHKIDSRTGHFTEDTIEEIKEYILNAKSVSFDKMLKEILNIDISNLQGYRVKKDRKPEFSKFEFYKMFVKKFEEQNIKPDWLYSSDKTHYNKVIYALSVSPNSKAIEDILKDRVSDISFSQTEIEILKNIKLKYNQDFKKNHSLSESILKRALKDMKNSGYQFNYMQIMKKQEYEKEMIEYFQQNYSKNENPPFLINDEYVDEIITNPQVKKTLRKAIKVINKIIEVQGDYPYVIQVESTKEMHSKIEKMKIEEQQKIYEELNNKAKIILQQNGLSITPKHIDNVINWEETNHKCAYCGKDMGINEIINIEFEHILPVSQTMDSTKENIICSCQKCNNEKKNRTPWEYLSSINQYDKFKQKVLNEFKMSQKKKDNLLFEGSIEKYSLKFINRNLRDTAYGTIALIEELNKYNEYLYFKTGYRINIVSSPGQLTHKIRNRIDIEAKDRNYLYHHAVDAMILASLADTNIGEVLIESQNTPKYWLNNKTKDIDTMIKNVELNNFMQIKDFNNNCVNQPIDEKDSLVKRSFEVYRNPIRQFSNANYVKYIKKGNEYYILKQIDNIYDTTIRDLKGTNGKKLFDQLFDKFDKQIELLCEEKDPKLFEKLKNIYYSHKDSKNPFVQECIFANGLEVEKNKFNYLIHGIRKTDKPNSPIVVKLRYIQKVNFPYIKTLKAKRKNLNNEFIETKQQEYTYIGLDSLAQASVRIYYSIDEQKFIFMPIYAICYKNGKIDRNNKYYIELCKKYIENKKVKYMFDIYCGNVLGVYKKDGTYHEFRFSTFNKATNSLECKNDGYVNKKIGSTDKRIIVYTQDILGNKYKKFDTNDKI